MTGWIFFTDKVREVCEEENIMINNQTHIKLSGWEAHWTSGAAPNTACFLSCCTAVFGFCVKVLDGIFRVWKDIPDATPIYSFILQAVYREQNLIHNRGSFEL